MTRSSAWMAPGAPSASFEPQPLARAPAHWLAAARGDHQQVLERRHLEQDADHPKRADHAELDDLVRLEMSL
jgi:hypothetical protein